MSAAIEDAELDTLRLELLPADELLASAQPATFKSTVYLQARYHYLRGNAFRARGEAAEAVAEYTEAKAIADGCGALYESAISLAGLAEVTRDDALRAQAREVLDALGMKNSVAL
jgi:hypothetical protein